jgi:hypothetical protein
MLRKSLFFVALMLCVMPVFAQDELRQWASSAEATSEFSRRGGSADQATGEPDVEDCEDSGDAWASEEKDGVDELTVYFDEPVVPTELNIYQNFGRGSIDGIELIPEDGSRNIRVRGAVDDEDDECPGVFSVSFDDIEDLVIGAVISVDQRNLEEYNQIDAVELVGLADTGLRDNNGDNGNSTNNSNSDLPFGRSVSCDDGGAFDNGVEFTVIQMRVRSTYTVTAIGLNGFDPVLAVLDETGDGLCNDNDSVAANYAVYLPTTGEVGPDKSSAQVIFTNTATSANPDFRNITFVVGGADNQEGEFVLLVEGLTLSSADGYGDTLSAYLAPATATSGVPLTAYMISVTDVFDPWIGLINTDYEVLEDSDGNSFSCDDAGSRSCWGDSTKMSGFGVTRNGGRLLPGGDKDAMITIPLDESFSGLNINFLMSTIQGTYGDYIVAFHAGTTEP